MGLYTSIRTKILVVLSVGIVSLDAATVTFVEVTPKRHLGITKSHVVEANAAFFYYRLCY